MTPFIFHDDKTSYFSAGKVDLDHWFGFTNWDTITKKGEELLILTLKTCQPNYGLQHRCKSATKPSNRKQEVLTGKLICNIYNI